MITTIYQEGDPQLQAFSSMLTAQSSADLTWTQEGQQVMVGRETREYDELRAAEVLLQVRQGQLKDAEAAVELAREEAAEHLLVMEDLTAEARTARERVAARSSPSGPTPSGWRSAPSARTAPSSASCARRRSGSSG